MHPRAWASSILGVESIHVEGDDETNGRALTGVGFGKYPDASNGPRIAFGTAIEFCLSLGRVSTEKAALASWSSRISQRFFSDKICGPMHSVRWCNIPGVQGDSMDRVDDDLSNSACSGGSASCDPRVSIMLQ